jgi:hypothetical protein
MTAMELYSLFISYTEKRRAGRSRTLEPLLISAESISEASRVASAVADFAFIVVASSILIRVVGADENTEPIDDVRRPTSH